MAKFDVKSIVALVVVIVVAVYLVAYTLPGAAGVISNSTGAWTNPDGVAGGPVNAGVRALAQIVVPIIVMVALVMYLVKHATG